MLSHAKKSVADDVNQRIKFGYSSFTFMMHPQPATAGAHNVS